MNPLDAVRLEFTPESLLALNLVLAAIMFGVALELKVEDFRRVVRAPRAPLVGLFAQFIALPALTFGLATVLDAPASVTLGMIVVGACPGGNVSNIICWLARADVALSVSMTAVSTAAAVVMTPLNIALWGGLSPKTAALLAEVQLDGLALLLNVAWMLGLPLVLGMWVGARFPAGAKRVQPWFARISVVALASFIGIAFAKNVNFFVEHIHRIVGYVTAHNAMALSVGYGLARLARLPEASVRAVTIEVGIQNSGLGLVLIFGFMHGLGGAAMVAAWWGVWHIIAGLSLAAFWRRRTRIAPTAPPTT